MRGRVHRSDISVTREEEYEINYLQRNRVNVTWTASFDAPLRSKFDQVIENLNLSFTGSTYDEALNKLLAEFEALDIKVVL